MQLLPLRLRGLFRRRRLIRRLGRLSLTNDEAAGLDLFVVIVVAQAGDVENENGILILRSTVGDVHVLIGNPKREGRLETRNVFVGRLLNQQHGSHFPRLALLGAGPDIDGGNKGFDTHMFYLCFVLFFGLPNAELHWERGAARPRRK